MKLTYINIKFNPGKRPQVICTFDQLIIDAIDGADYEARYHADSNTWVYRADCGDYISAGAEMKGQGRAQIKMVDGFHTIAALHPTNAVAVNQLFGMDYAPAMDCGVQQEELVLPGHVNAIEVAKYLWANWDGSDARSEEQPAMAVVEWPSGIRIYEPVLVSDEGPKPNRDGDMIIFLVNPEKYVIGAHNDG